MIHPPNRQAADESSCSLTSSQSVTSSSVTQNLQPPRWVVSAQMPTAAGAGAPNIIQTPLAGSALAQYANRPPQNLVMGTHIQSRVDPPTYTSLNAQSRPTQIPGLAAVQAQQQRQSMPLHPSVPPANMPPQTVPPPSSVPASSIFVQAPQQSSYQPSAQPSYQPGGQPSYQPSGQPSYQPSGQPSYQPSGQPSYQPSGQPSYQPSGQPSYQPSGQPSYQPSPHASQTGGASLGASSPLARDPVHHTSQAANPVGPIPQVELSKTQQPQLPTSRLLPPPSAKRQPKMGQDVEDSMVVKPGTFGQTKKDSPNAWVTVPVPDQSGGLQFRPRGFSVDNSSEAAASACDSTPWEYKDKYLMAVRAGPTECPDHILAKHKNFNASKDSFTSPFSIFYFDETAPNNALLENDVGKEKVLKRDPKTGKHIPPKGSIAPKRKVSQPDDRSTDYTESDGSIEDARLPTAAVQAAARGLDASMGGGGGGASTHSASRMTGQPGGAMDPVGAGIDLQAAAESRLNTRTNGTQSMSSTHYVSLRPQTERPGCCGAKKVVATDGGSVYGTASQGTYEVKYDATTPNRYVQVVTLSHESGSSDETTSESSIRYHTQNPARFVAGAEVPPSYPPRASMAESSSLSSSMPQRRSRACCGVARRGGGSASNSMTSYTSESITTETYTETATHEMNVRGKSIQSSSKVSSSVTVPKRARGATVCGVCRAGNGRRHQTVSSSSSTYTSSSGDTSSSTISRKGQQKASRAAPPTQEIHQQDHRGTHIAPREEVVLDSRSSSSSTSKLRHGSRSSQGKRQSASAGGRTSNQQRLAPLKEDQMTVFTDGFDDDVPPIRPSKKKESEKDTSYNVRKMYFDVEDLRVPDKGTGLKMLPAYSTSYKNFPVICYDVIAPNDYTDFFRTRKTPGMYA